MHHPVTIFVIGANGVGKSTILSHLASQLSESSFALHDFDERGVPSNANKAWRISETAYWIAVGEENKKKDLTTIVFGFMKPEEVELVCKNLEKPRILLLDVENKDLEQRIRSRYKTNESLAELNRTTGKTLEKFTRDNVYVASLLRKSCEAYGCQIIDTTSRTPEAIAKQVYLNI